MTRPPLLTAAIHRRMVDRFNTLHPVGDTVRVWPGVMGDGPGEIVVVRAPGAVVLGGHTPVVYVTGGQGCIHLLHVRAHRDPKSPPNACPECGAVSHNPNDARHRYCGRCHRFADATPGPAGMDGAHG